MIVSAFGLSTTDLEGHRLSWDLNLSKGKVFSIRLSLIITFPSHLTSITQPTSGNRAEWCCPVWRHAWWRAVFAWSLRPAALPQHRSYSYWITKPQFIDCLGSGLVFSTV